MRQQTSHKAANEMSREKGSCHIYLPDGQEPE